MTASSCRATAATSSTTSRSRAGAHPRPAAPADGVPQSAATLNLLRAFATGGLPTSAACINGCWVFSRIPAIAALQELATGFGRAQFHARLRLDLESHPELRATDFYTSTRRFCSVTSRPSPGSIPPPRLVRDLGPHDLDRRPYRQLDHGMSNISRHQESDRPEMRPSLKPDSCCG